MRAILIALIMLPAAVFAKDLGTVGNTYPIAEKDMIHEIEDRASNVDWASMFKQEEEKIREEAGRGSSARF
jgi:conjugal transfer pilus assembly protein TraW